MNSTLLIEYFNKRKEALGEKATDFTMFMEGYGAGIADLDVRNAIVKETIDKACKILDDCLPNIEYITNVSVYRQNKSKFIESIRKAMEE